MRRGALLACSAAVLWGTWPLYVHASGVQGPALAFVTMLVMALPSGWLVKREALRDRGATLALVVVGLADAANAALYFSALARGPVVVATLTHALAPMLVALLGPVLIAEPRSRRAIIAAPMVLAGLALVLARPSGGAGADDWGLTALLGGGSALFYATNVLASRVAVRAYRPLAIVSLHSVVAVVALVVVFGRAALPPLTGTLWVAVVGAVVNGWFAALVFNLALVELGAPRTGVLTALEPLTASLIGVFVYAEPAGWLTAVGTAVVLLAGAWSAAEPGAATSSTAASA
jgi:drug/metabolite transporter (DMT)-like permease